MSGGAVISGYATLDFVVRSEAAPMGAGTYPAEIPGAPAWPRAGGAPLYAGRRLAAHGIAAAPLVSIGADANGWAYREACLEAGLSLEGVAVHEGRTPACILVHHRDGGCTCFIDPGAAAERLAPAQTQTLAKAGLVLVAAAPQALTREVLQALRPGQSLAWIAKGDPTAFPDTLGRELAARAEVIFCNAGERALVDRLRATPPPGQILIETRGGAGLRLEGPSGAVDYRIEPVAAPDATGAGDTFAGEFLARRLSGASLDAAVAGAIEAARSLLQSRLA